MKKDVSRDVALNRLAALCAQSEKCISDVKKKLSLWNLSDEDSDFILDFLLENKFVDESRFASAFVRDKVRFAKWGRSKIVFALKAKSIPSDVISQALQSVDQQDFSSTMETVLRAKLKSISYKDFYDAKNKLVRFGASRGFEFDGLIRMADKLIDELKNN